MWIDDTLENTFGIQVPCMHPTGLDAEERRHIKRPTNSGQQGLVSIETSCLMPRLAQKKFCTCRNALSASVLIPAQQCGQVHYIPTQQLERTGY